MGIFDEKNGLEFSRIDETLNFKKVKHDLEGGRWRRRKKNKWKEIMHASGHIVDTAKLKAKRNCLICKVFKSGWN